MAEKPKKPVSAKTRARLVKLLRAMGSDNSQERETARRHIDEIALEHRLSWNDVLEIVAREGRDDQTPSDQDYAPAEPTPGVNPLDLVEYLVHEYTEITPHYTMAVALWVLHVHVYDRFMVTPRLALTSPVRGCGKTVLLELMETRPPRAITRSIVSVPRS